MSYVDIENSEAGSSVRAKINKTGSDVEISFRIVSEFAEIENEINYFQTGSIVYADSEQIYYEYNGSIWVPYVMTIPFAKFDIAAGAPSYAEGQVYWDGDDHTFSVQTDKSNVTLQIGQEFYVRIVNKTGSELIDGQTVYINDVHGNRPTVELAIATASETSDSVIGVITANILENAEGYVTTSGIVRGYNTSDFTAGDTLYVSETVEGELQNTEPVSPNHAVKVAIALNKTNDGSIFIFIQLGTELWGLHDVDISSVADNNVLRYDSASSTWKNEALSPTVSVPLSFESFDPAPTKTSVSNIHGGILSLATGQPLDSVPTDIVVIKGIGKLVIVVNAGSDIAGDITITGESIDRNTGASTPADTDVITIDALTTDTSSTDSNGNTLYAISDAYISSKWFTGTVTLSTSDLTLTDVDVYHVSFEQFNDESNITITTFDMNLTTTGVSAEVDAYLYALEVTDSKCDIAIISSLNIGADGETAISDKAWRLRRGNINKAINGNMDGIWASVTYSNSPSQVEDATLKVWATQIQTVTI